MRSTFAIIALAIVGATAQGVTETIAPSSPAPAGCSTSFSGEFTITVANVTSSKKRSLAERQLSGVLMMTLADGVLTDMAGRTGYIAANEQFQFDSPPQTGAKFTSGFSVCGNNSLALGGSAIWYSCNNGEVGGFDIYDASTGAQCFPVYVVASGSASATTAVGQSTDGQVQASTIVSEKSEGQPIATQIVSEKSEGQPIIATVTTMAPVVSEKSEGQPVILSTPMPISQKSDGQIVATSVLPVSQKSDGQPVALSSAPPVSVKSDGQPVVLSTPAAAPTSAPPVSEKTDGQPIGVTTPAPYPTTTPALVSQKTDGQVVVSSVGTISTAYANGTVTTSAPAQFTGAAASSNYGVGAMAAGVLGLVALL